MNVLMVAPPRTAEPTRGRRLVWWPYLLAGGLLTQFLLRLLLSAGRTVPTMVPDETGYLLAGRLLSGGAAGDLSGRTFYQAGYGLLIAPVSWLAPDPAAGYRVVLGINALLGAGLLLLMFGLMRRMGMTRWPAFVMANAGALLPGLVYWSQFALSDMLLTVIVTGWVLLVHTWLRSGTAWASVAAGALAAYASTIHSRGMVVLIVHLGLVGLVLLRRRPGRGPVTVLVPLAGGLAGWLLNRWVEARIYPAGSFAFLPYLTDRLTSVSGLAWAGTLGAGKAWYLIVSTWGLGGLGVLVLVSVAVRRTSAWADRVTAGAVLVVAGVIAVVMSLALPDEGTVGNYAYGRYLLPLTPVLVAAGAAALSRMPLPVLSRSMLGLAGAAVATLGVVCLYAGDRLATRSYSNYDFPEMAFLSGEWDGLPLWRGTWMALLLFALVLVARVGFGRRRAVLATGCALSVLSIVLIAVVDQRVTDRWDARFGAATSLRTVGLRPDDRVAMTYPGMPWQIWTSHAFQVRGGLTPFNPGYRGAPAPGISLIIVPWDRKSDPHRSWPAARTGWHLALAQPSYLGGWAAWRPDSWRPSAG
ncbi:MAG: hypothetical protein ABIS86_17645 [Streptosporangiaceae bacterium]